MSATEADAIARLVWERGGPGRLPPKPDDPVVSVTWAELIECVAHSLAWHGGDPEKVSDRGLEMLFQQVLRAVLRPSAEGYVAHCADDFTAQLKQEAAHAR